MAIGDVFRIDVVFKSDLSPYVAVNGPHFKQQSALVLDTPEEDLVEAYREKVEAYHLGPVTSALRIVQYKVSPVPGTGVTYQLDLGVSGPTGTLTGDRLPPRVASILSFRSATPGKRGRGRMYLPPANEAANDSGAPTAGIQTTVNNLGTALLTGMGTGGLEFADWQWVVWSEADQVARPVTAFIARGYWGSQRDRTRIFASG